MTLYGSVDIDCPLIFCPVSERRTCIWVELRLGKRKGGGKHNSSPPRRLPRFGDLDITGGGSGGVVPIEVAVFGGGGGGDGGAIPSEVIFFWWGGRLRSSPDGGCLL